MKATGRVFMAAMAVWAGLAFGQTTPNPDFATVKGKLDEGGTLFVYASVEGLANSVIDEFEPFLTATGGRDAQEFLRVARAGVKGLGLDQLDDVGISYLPLSGQSGRMKMYLQLKQRTGAFQLFGGAPYELESVRFIPSDAVWACVENVTVQPLIPLLEQVLQEAAGPNAVEVLHKGLAHAKEQGGFDIPTLLSSMGKEVGLYLRLDASKPVSIPISRNFALQIPAPGFAIFCGVKDRGLFEAICGRLKRSGVTLQPLAGVEGLEAQTIQVPENPLGLKPTLAQGAGWFFFVSQPEELGRMVDARKTQKDLRASPEFQSLSTGLPRQINGVTFVSPRLGQEMEKVLNQLGNQPEIANTPQWQMMRKFCAPSPNSVGQVGVWLNEPRAIYSITQGDVHPSDAMRGLMVAPAAVMAAVAIPNFLEAQGRSKVSRVRTDMRSMATAIEAYWVDNNAYPAWTLDPAQSARPSAPGEKPIPSFRLRTQATPNLLTLTTPIAYMTGYFPDAFAEKGATLGYYAPVKNGAAGWILFSPGPDGVFDLDWNVYDPSVSQPSPELLARFTYDPTNGTVSGGDIWRVKQ